MSKVEIQVDDREVRAALNKLLRSCADLSEPMTDIARMLRNVAEQSFQDEADPWGHDWPRLAESTIARRRKGPGDSGALSILQDTGQLAASVTSGSGVDWAEVGAAKEYAAIHQFGGQAGRGRKTRIPPRPYLPITSDGELPQELKADILEILSDFLESAMGG